MATPVMVTVSGNLDEQPGVDDPSASVTFSRKWWTVGPDGTIVEPGVQTATVDASGNFTLAVMSNNDPAWRYFGPGDDVAYEITIKTSVDGSGVTYRYRAIVPYNAPDGAMTLPVDVDGLVTAPGVWAAVNHSHADLVTDAELAAAIAGIEGGEGAVASVNGQTGVVTLDAADVGADPTGSAAAVQYTANLAYTESQNAITGLAFKADAAATTSALAAKAPLESPAFTGTPTGITATHVGLGAVNNTSDADKPVSTATASALTAKANLAGTPTFTGVPAAPTAAAGTNTTQLATTAFVTTADNLKANLASPTLTGTPAAPTAAAATNTTQIATTAFVQGKVPVITNLTTPGTTNYVDPGATCKYLDVTIISPGGGGGSGRRGAAGTVRAGGSSGGSGGFAHVTIPYSAITFPVAMTLGTAGTGGTAQATNDTDGVAGTGGNGANFGTYLRVGTTGGGSGGGTGAGTGGFSAAGQTYGQNGVAAAATGGVPGNPSSYPAGASAGGAGGGITSADVPSNGGAGAAGQNPAVASGGVVGGVTPGIGTSQSTNSALPGNGGGGGAASITAAAQAGMAGGVYGGGGGGGGASLNGFASGAGGNGGGGIIQVIAVF